MTENGGMMNLSFESLFSIDARFDVVNCSSGLFLIPPAWTPSLPPPHSPNLLSQSLQALKLTNFLEHRSS